MTISKYDICEDFIVFTTWDSNKTYAYSLHDNYTFEMHRIENEKVFVTGLVIFNSPNNSKFISISSSDGTLLIFIFENKNLSINHFFKNILKRKIIIIIF